MRIEIYYSGIKSANDAVERFKNEGFNNSAVDLNDNYIDFNNYKYNFSDAIINSGTFSNDIGKTSYMSYGLGNSHDILNSNYKVIVNINSIDSENEINIIKKIASETGGNFKITM